MLQDILQMSFFYGENYLFWRFFFKNLLMESVFTHKIHAFEILKKNEKKSSTILRAC
jgi:hypothetical protein